MEGINPIQVNLRFEQFVDIRTYEDIYKVISNILEKKITKEHLTNYLKHSYKIYKS
jgi:hypothetical protein